MDNDEGYHQEEFVGPLDDGPSQMGMLPFTHFSMACFVFLSRNLSIIKKGPTSALKELRISTSTILASRLCQPFSIA